MRKSLSVADGKSDIDTWEEEEKRGGGREGRFRPVRSRRSATRLSWRGNLDLHVKKGKGVHRDKGEKKKGEGGGEKGEITARRSLSHHTQLVLVK